MPDPPRNSRKAKEQNGQSLNEIMAKLSSDGKLIVSALLQELQNMRTDMNSKFDEISSLKADIVQLQSDSQTQSTQITSLKSEINTLRSTITKMEGEIDQADAYERRDTVIFSGDSVPTGRADEDSSDIIVNLVNKKLKMQRFNRQDINIAHRLGRLQQGEASPDKRAIIVKLCHRDVKRRLFSAAKSEKVGGLFINESLTPTRRKIMYALRQMKRAHPNIVKGSSSFEGKVFVHTLHSRTAPNGSTTTKHPINTRNELLLFCQNFLKKPLEDFLAEWN